MFRNINKANKEIEKLRLDILNLKSKISELTSEIIQNENTVSVQDFADMRLRAQKAELALEAIRQADIDSRIKINMRNATEKEDIKNSIIEAFMSHLQNVKVN